MRQSASHKPVASIGSMGCGHGTILRRRLANLFFLVASMTVHTLSIGRHIHCYTAVIVIVELVHILLQGRIISELQKHSLYRLLGFQLTCLNRDNTSVVALHINTCCEKLLLPLYMPMRMSCVAADCTSLSSCMTQGLTSIRQLPLSSSEIPNSRHFRYFCFRAS